MTGFWHPAIAASLTVIVGLTTGQWWAGAALGAGIFLGREHAQAEYRWIETYGWHLRANMPWWGGFDPKVWNAKSLTDWALPLAAVSLVAVL